MLKENGVLTSVKEEDIALLKKDPEEFWKDVKRIGRAAFKNCKDLKEIALYGNFRSIYGGAFRYCSKLETIYLSKNINYISPTAFPMNLLKIEVDKENPYWKDYKQNMLITYSQSGEEILYYALKNAKEIPSGIKKIIYSFECNEGFEDLKIPFGVCRISSFWNCKNLKRLDIPDSVNKIDDIFYIVDCPNLQTIIIPENLYEEKFIDSHIKNCPSLKHLYVRLKNGQLKEMTIKNSGN